MWVPEVHIDPFINLFSTMRRIMRPSQGFTSITGCQGSILFFSDFFFFKLALINNTENLPSHLVDNVLAQKASLHLLQPEKHTKCISVFRF